MHRQLCCGEPIEKGYGWSWAWQQLLNLEPWEHPCVRGINIAPGLGGIGFGAGRRQRQLRQILWLVWKYFCCHSINLRHQITFREHWGTVAWQCVFLPGSHGEGSTAGGGCPSSAASPHTLWEVLPQTGKWSTEAFYFSLKFTLLYFDRALQIFIILPFCTLLRMNYILQSSLFFKCGMADPGVWFCFFCVTCWLLWLGVGSLMEYLLLSFLPGCWEADKLSAVWPDTLILLLCYSPVPGNDYYLSLGPGKEQSRMLARRSTAV